MESLNGFASCPKQLELLLKQELQQLGVEQAREGLAGVHFSTDPQTLLECLLWSRLANRFYLKLTTAKCHDKNDLYQAVSSIDWLSLCNTEPQTLSIRFNGVNDRLKNSQFSSQVSKDAICDQILQTKGTRPQVVKSDAQLSVQLRLKHKQLEIFQDLCGQSLHQRHYRQQNNIAPLKENLAAAILIRADWHKLAAQGYNLIDPMCGSGTLPLEAWQIACDIAPGSKLHSQTLSTWQHFDPDHWNHLTSQAQQRAEQGIQNFKGQIIGIDHHKKSIELANHNLQALPHNKRISIQYQTLDKFRIPPRHNLIVCNPPYGVRLQKNHLQSWQQLSHWLRQRANGSQAAILTPDEAKGRMLCLREYKSYALFNGSLPIQLRLFHIDQKNHLKTPQGQHFPLPPQAQSLANRLKKNQTALQNWIKQQQIQAYRLYDAEMPEFASSIDCYRDHILVREYQAPKTIDPAKAQKHLQQTLLAIQAVLQPNSQLIHCKTRQRQTQNQQYGKTERQNRITITEQGRNYLIDLEQYIDTGLFLDHRWLRNHIQSQSKGKKILNLFCYTGSISVAAGKGQAAQITSVDSSKTYLKWAEENFKLNRLTTKHQLIKQDVITFLNQDQQQYDIIIADPPTYSNSHSRSHDWEVQRDHQQLLTLCAKRLKPNGSIYFSNNYRKFKLDPELQQQFTIKNLTTQSLDPDFKNSKIHHCYQLKNLG